MSDIFNETQSFRNYQSNLGRDGRASAATTTLTTKVRIFVPANNNPNLRWRLTLFLMDVVRSPASAESMKVGAGISLVSMYAEKPGALVRALLNDPDVEAIIIDVYGFDEGIPIMERRGDKATDDMDSLRKIVKAAHDFSRGRSLFVDQRVQDIVMSDMGSFVNAITSIETQIWILIAKAVTAPDTAEESEGRRWAKYVQQKRVNPLFLISPQWINDMRSLIAASLSLRKFMVELLMEAKKGRGTKGRIMEIVSDIGNYVEETGMAGFFATIKFGLETKFPALALNELQSDLNTMKSLMILYRSIGPKAPFMVLLEDSIQTKFAPGSYPLLWSFAMGVGTTIDRAMGALNINRSYLEPVYFRLGQQSAKHQAGNVDKEMAEKLGLTEDQIVHLSANVKDASQGRDDNQINIREGKFTNVVDDIQDHAQSSSEDYNPSKKSFSTLTSITSTVDSADSRSAMNESMTTTSLLKLRQRLAEKKGDSKNSQDTPPKPPRAKDQPTDEVSLMDSNI